MLVLTRKPQEVIHIGPNVTITIVRVSGKSVRIGIEAPKELHVRRGEIPANDASAEPDPSCAPTPRLNRPVRLASMLARVKSLTVVESAAESQGSETHVPEAPSRHRRAIPNDCLLGF